jgi:hypothetical protein
MKTEVITERPAFTLQGSSFDGVGEVVEISELIEDADSVLIDACAQEVDEEE